MLSTEESHELVQTTLNSMFRAVSAEGQTLEPNGTVIALVQTLITVALSVGWDWEIITEFMKGQFENECRHPRGRVESGADSFLSSSDD